MSELKNCPFCGAIDTNAVTLITGRRAIQCDQCHAEGPGGKDNVSAKEAWNTRLVATDGWISVEDRAPELDQHYDAWHRGSRLANCGPYFGNGWSEKDIKENMLMREYTHWMPLPGAPK